MKKIILTTLCITTICSTTLFAQQQIAFFQVDDNNYIQHINFKPNIQLDYFSTEQGGKMIVRKKIANTGLSQDVFNIDATPAFLLNRKSDINAEGDNQVYFLNTKEFVAKNIELKAVAGVNTIAWNAQIPVGNNISFKIKKQVGISDPITLKTIVGIQGEQFAAYYIDDEYNASAQYTMEIMKDNTQLRYSAAIMSNQNLTTIKVYPTIVNDVVYADIPNNDIDQFSTYSISNVAGQKIKSGILTNQHNEIQVDNIPSGNYIISILKENKNTSIKFMKQ